MLQILGEICICIARLFFKTKKKTIVQTLIDITSFTNYQTDSKVTIKSKYHPNHFFDWYTQGQIHPCRIFWIKDFGRKLTYKKSFVILLLQDGGGARGLCYLTLFIYFFFHFHTTLED